MLAASYWSLLNPALELAEQQGWGMLNACFQFNRHLPTYGRGIYVNNKNGRFFDSL